MNSVRRQMVVLLTIGTVLIFSILGFFSNDKLNKLSDLTKEQYKEIASARADEVGKELNGFVDQIRIVSQSPIIKSMDFSLIKAYLPYLVLKEKYISMTVATPDGKGWATYGGEIDISKQEQYREIILNQKEYHISQPFISPYINDTTPITIVSHVVKNNGEIVGLANIVVEVEFLNKIVRQMELEGSGYGWIVNHDGLVVAHPDSNVAINKRVSDFITNDDAMIEEIISSTSGAVEYIDDRGEKMVAFFKKIEGAPDWTFIVSIPTKEIFAEVWETRNAIINAIVISLILIIVYSIFYANSITKPILELKDVFEKAAGGDLNVKANEEVPNEIGIAAKSFNQMLEKIKELTYKDNVTGLNNYNGFYLELPHRIKILKKVYAVIAIVIISIDDFKRINSIGGYEVGDEVLRDLAKRLNHFIGEGEAAARFLGDEFILLMGEESEDLLEKRILKIWQQCSSEIKIREQEFIIKTSIGISSLKNHEDNIEDTINEATMAKLTVKKLGGNNYKFYNSEMDAWIKKEQKIENELYHAIDNNELYLVYQPIIQLNTQKIVGTEALLRWKNKKYGDISPLTLIKIAEQRGFFNEIGKWILTEACKQNQRWLEKGYGPLIVSVNVSPLQLEQASFVEMVQQILQETGLPPQYLELEITETSAMNGVEEVLFKLKKLKEMGVGIAIDDFGTGYSSLAYFTQFPIDTLKIDRTFINKMLDDNNAKTIVTTIISMAHAMKIKTTAEGVETLEQFHHLQEEGCELLQGYLISKPIEPADVQHLLNVRNTKEQ